VNLDALGLTAMGTYRLDFFWAERHLTQSNFRIDTSLEFVDCGIDPVR
jgi:fibro-slime domain-containing protein